MDKRLQGQKVAILVTDMFEEAELRDPRQALEDAGAETHVIAPHDGQIQAANHFDKGEKYVVDLTLDEADPDDYDAVLLPGGALNADQLRVDTRAQAFIRRIDQDGKPVAVICHGPWLLISSGLVRGRTLASFHTIRDDVTNAGGNWLNHAVVVDDNWVSSRKPDDIPEFNRAMIETFAGQQLTYMVPEEVELAFREQLAEEEESD